MSEKTICGIDCRQCSAWGNCSGCTATKGNPLGGGCIVAECCQSKGQESCGSCASCALREKLSSAFNALGIEGMDEVKGLNALSGSYINLCYTLRDGREIKLLDDRRIYLGNQLCKAGSERCYGLATDGTFLLVSEYGDSGTDAEMVLYKKLSGPVLPT